MSLISFAEFPNSKTERFTVTSPHTPTYNCIAWAFGDNTKWYWPNPSKVYYWPKSIPREENVDAFIALFASINYQLCENGNYEEGYCKIAIFVNSENVPTHAARQLENGYWTSKLGNYIDVQHTIKSMEGGKYGKVSIYMKRSIE